MSADLCPCGSGQPLNECCAPCLSGQRPARTAKQLMRSRYTAYVLLDEAYLLRSWHPSTRPDRLALRGAAPVKWLGLKLVRVEAGDEQDDAGLVEFSARYKPAGAAGCLQEVSRFVKEQGEWFYVSGDLAEV